MINRNDREGEQDLIEKEDVDLEENHTLKIFSRKNIKSFVYTVFVLFGIIGAYYLLVPLFSSMQTGSSGLDFLAGVTVGFGVNMKTFSIHYSYAPYFDLGGGHRISLSLGG